MDKKKEEILKPENRKLTLRDVNERAKHLHKTAIEIIQEVSEDLCNNYCKYPDSWDEEKEGIPLEDSDICTNCPLNRL